MNPPLPKPPQTPILSMLRANLQHLADVTQTFVPCPVCDSTGRVTRPVPDMQIGASHVIGCVVSTPCPLCRPEVPVHPDLPSLTFSDHLLASRQARGE